MSREQVNNKEYTLAFGVDYTCGNFVQIWDKSWGDSLGQPAIDVSSKLGVYVNYSKTLTDNRQLQQYVERLTYAWHGLREIGLAYPNLGPEQVIELSHTLGLFSTELAKKVYQLWD